MPKTYKQVNAHGIIGGDLVRSLRLMLTVTSISIICILCCSLVSALNPDEASVSLVGVSQTAYAGDIVSIRINFKSNFADQLRIYSIGLHFDWMSSDSFAGPDLSANPVIVPSEGNYVFDPIVIQIPSNVSAGTHSYFVGVDGVEGLSTTLFSWDSSTFTIEIRAASESYSELMSQVENKLNESINANYKNAEAQSLLQQAQVEFGNATSFAAQGRLSEAIESLQIANDFLNQAHAAEQKSDEQKAELQSLLFYLAIIAIVVIIVVSIIVVVVRKKRKQTDSGADQSLETIEEQS
jgi:hypothetical protein